MKIGMALRGIDCRRCQRGGCLLESKGPERKAAEMGVGAGRCGKEGAISTVLSS